MTVFVVSYSGLGVLHIVGDSTSVNFLAVLVEVILKPTKIT
jgi:hypothetical protein